MQPRLGLRCFVARLPQGKTAKRINPGLFALSVRGIAGPERARVPGVPSYVDSNLISARYCLLVKSALCFHSLSSKVPGKHSRGAIAPRPRRFSDLKSTLVPKVVNQNIFTSHSGKY